MIDFNKLIDQHLKREFRPKQAGRYYPSEIGSCLRKVWYSYKMPRETEADLVRIFQAGNILHDFVVEVIKSEKNPEVELIWTEYPFKMKIKDYLISGRVDDLILLKMSGQKLLMEVKSTKSLHYIEVAQPHHIMQLQLYMHATGVHNGALLYIEKNTLNTKIFTIPYREVIAAEAIHRFETLHKSLGENRIPEPEARLQKNRQKLGWMCSNCDYRIECFQENPKGSVPGEDSS